MKSIQIKSVGVEFPTNVTTVGVDIIETAGRITRVVESVSVAVEGIYPAMNSELFDIVLQHLKEAGFDVMTTQTAE